MTEPNPYDTPEGRASAPTWPQDENFRNATVPAVSSPQGEVFPTAPVPGAVPKNAVLYCILGIIIPGLPSLLLRQDKAVGGIQLGVWVLSWILTIVLIGFLIWPAVAIWAAITGYMDAQLWNRRHGFIT